MNSNHKQKSQPRSQNRCPKVEGKNKPLSFAVCKGGEFELPEEKSVHPDVVSWCMPALFLTRISWLLRVSCAAPRCKLLKPTFARDIVKGPSSSTCRPKLFNVQCFVKIEVHHAQTIIFPIIIINIIVENRDSMLLLVVNLRSW